MHTVELLEGALGVARQLGFAVRQEWLGGSSGGCLLKGQKWIFLDVAQSPQEQLETVIEAIRGEAKLGEMQIPSELSQLVTLRKSA